ncbi:GlmU family protein [Rufibacter sp. LB8]|uniref:GlmU family protein n=1 Tax=Rufibacter sp. LB8 TaxID=2777781 RepID=UPI00178C483A|nr:GlmU family protein [Rufibacter sp. LB8]
MNLILFDEPVLRANLLPFTFTRPVADIRIGILTIAQKWSTLSNEPVSYLTQDYLQGKFPPIAPGQKNNVYVNGAVCPTPELLDQIKSLAEGQWLTLDGLIIAINAGNQAYPSVDALYQQPNKTGQGTEVKGAVTVVRQPWEIFKFNGDQIRSDFQLLTQGRESQPITDKYTMVYAPENIFVEEGAKIKAAILNAENGPIYIGKNAEVHEGAIIRGPFSLGEESHVNIGGKMRGDISIGPFCKVGGEVNNCVFFGYSNKGHEGFLGNSVIGEWCNFGADTNNSNLKNNYAEVKIWSHAKERFVNTGLQFCGLMMADHVKCGINTMFNTGTVVGIGANVFGAGYPRNFIPAFSWGGVGNIETFQLRKFFEVADVVMGRRGLAFTEEERNIYAHLFDSTKPSRTWDKPVSPTA